MADGAALSIWPDRRGSRIRTGIRDMAGGGMKRPKISRRAETRPYGRVSAPTGNCRKFLTQLIDAGFPFHPEHRVQSPDRVRVKHLIGIVAPGRRPPHRSPTARSGGPVPPRAHFYAHAGRSRPVVGTATDTGNSLDPADSGHCLPASASLHAPVPRGRFR